MFAVKTYLAFIKISVGCHVSGILASTAANLMMNESCATEEGSLKVSLIRASSPIKPSPTPIIWEEKFNLLWIHRVHYLGLFGAIPL